MSLAIYQQLVVGLKVTVNNPSKQITACKRNRSHKNDADATFCKTCGGKIVEQRSHELDAKNNIFSEVEDDLVYGEFTKIEVIGYNEKQLEAIFINDDKTEICVRVADNQLIDNKNIMNGGCLTIKMFDKLTIDNRFTNLKPIVETLKKLDFILSVEPMLFNINAISA